MHFRLSTWGDRDVQAVAGVRGQWGDWDYDASLNHGRNEFTYRLRNSLNASLGPTSPTRFKTGDYESGQTLVNLDISRVFGAHTFATGVEFRHETFETGAGDPASYAAGPYTDRPTGSQAGGGLTPQDEADLDRDVASVYASVSSSFGEKLSTDAAVRYGWPRPAVGYKALFWHSTADGSRPAMHGHHGQRVVIDLPTRTVLVHTAVDHEGLWAPELMEMFDAVTRL